MYKINIIKLSFGITVNFKTSKDAVPVSEMSWFYNDCFNSDFKTGMLTQYRKYLRIY
jgi:hypothetical protein